MLAVLWAGGSLLFAAEPVAQRGAAPAVSESESPAAAAPAQAEPAEKAPEKAQSKTGERTPAETEEKTGQKASTDGGAAEDKDPGPKGAPATAADRTGSPQRFTPSEQVRADFDVSFPIDI